MFNTYSNKFNFDINAVSGTLRKSHPKSRFSVRTVSNDTYAFDPDNPTIYYRGAEIVVLQIMLTGNDRCIIEYVNKEDFGE